MAFSLIVCLTAFGRFENMNGEYLTTPTPGAKGKYNTNWSEVRSPSLLHSSSLASSRLTDARKFGRSL